MKTDFKTLEKLDDHDGLVLDQQFEVQLKTQLTTHTEEVKVYKDEDEDELSQSTDDQQEKVRSLELLRNTQINSLCHDAELERTRRDKTKNRESGFLFDI